MHNMNIHQYNPDNIYDTLKTMKLTKLNLGSGNKYLKGYVNCELVKSVKSDKYFNLNEFPYPFKDSSAQEILLDNVLEHLQDVTKVIEESYRILAHNGVLRIYVPYFKSDGAAQDPTHIHFFTEHSMDYYSQGFEYNYYTNANFKLNKSYLFCDNKTTKSKIRALIPFKGIFKIFFFNIYDGVYFELVAKK